MDTATDAIAVFVKRCLAGNEHACELLYEQGVKRTYPVVVSRTEDPVLAEEITHNALTRCILQLNRLHISGSFFGWAKTIAVNEYHDHLRKRDNQNVSLDLLPDESVPNESWERFVTSIVLGESTVGVILQMVDHESRILLIENVLFGFSARELAERHSSSVAGMSKRLTRIKQKIWEQASANQLFDAF
ncbi:MAG TPA: sigma factor [Thermomicrobiales bacterium]|nr:sigma factor [Thermomicrobiales bacterium]